METKKVTKKEQYLKIREIVINSEDENKEELLEFVDKQIQALDNRAQKEKERSEKRKAEGDELRAAVKSVLNEDFQLVDDILSQIEGEDLTKSKIIARLTQLVKNGEAEKTEIKDADGKKKMGYKLV